MADLLGDALPFAVSKGTMQLGGNYHVTLADILDLRITLPLISVHGPRPARARRATRTGSQVPDLKVEGVELVLPVQNLSVAAVTVNGLTATGWLNPDGTMSLEQLLATARACASRSRGTRTGGARIRPGTEGDDWKVRVAAINVTGRDAGHRRPDDCAGHAVQVLAAEPACEGRDAGLRAARCRWRWTPSINEQAQLKASGSLALDPMVADLDVTLEKARMRIIQPYILPYADLTITPARWRAAGKLKMAPPEREGPEISFAGDVTIDGFKSKDNTLHEDFIDFTRVQFQKLQLRDGARRREHRPHPGARAVCARGHQSRADTEHLGRARPGKRQPPRRDQKRDADAALAAETKAQKRKREKSEAAAKKAAAAARKKAGTTVAVTAAPTEPEAMPIRIREVAIERGRMNFSDFNVQPNFAANIQDLSGKVTGLSSAFESRAKVDLKGRVGEFEPVTIAGELQPFAFDRFTDMGLKFENISLPLFNPYSGRFAGYNISKGKLTTDLHYLIQDRKLDAKHHIVIDQLEWGEATPPWARRRCR